MYKLPPYHPQLDSFDPEFSLSQEDIDFLVTNGFNVVRLYIVWPGVEPVKDQYNDTYLDVSERSYMYQLLTKIYNYYNYYNYSGYQ